MATIAEQLDRDFQSVIRNEKPYLFFKGLIAYIDYVLSKPSLEAVVEMQIAERDTKNAQVIQLEEKALTEMREAKAKLLAVIEKNGVDTDSFTRFRLSGGTANIIEEMEAFERDEYQKNGWHSDNLESYLFDIAANLRVAGYEKEIDVFIVSSDTYDAYWQRIDGPGHYTIFGDEKNAYIFSEARPQRFELMARIEKERGLKLWGDFEALLQFKQAYDAVAANGGFSSILRDENIHTPLDADNKRVIALMAEDLQILMGDGQDTYRSRYSHAPDRIEYLSVEAFKAKVQLVHNRLMQASEVSHATKDLSAADKKKLVILEKLKESWDLAPKKNSGPQMRQEALIVYEQHAGEVKIHENRFHQWLAEGKIDGYQLQDILMTFQQEGLITKFSFIDDSR